VGHVIAKVRLYNPHNENRFVELELLVDTGSTYTWVRQRRLEELGIKPSLRRMFRVVDNRVVERDVGEAIAGCMGRRTTTVVVFVEEEELREVEAVLAI